MSNTSNNRLRSITTFITSAVLLCAAALLLLNRQVVLDQISVWSFEPSVQVATISDKVEFTPKAKHVFYATHPSLEDQSTFNAKCPRQEASSPILGCYTTDDRIFIYDITNEELAGMEEVTAVHELLHAVWYRTSEAERSELSVKLKAAYEKTDKPELKKRMEYYQRTEPGEIDNELHAILGTEIASLSEDLEAYYAKFFDRSAVLKLHSQYESKYTALYTRADELYKNMEDLTNSIKSRTKEYELAAEQYSKDVESFNARATGGAFATQAQFNSERSALMSRSGTLNTQRQAINNDIQTYNAYTLEYQQIAQQIDGLNSSLDSFKQIDQAPSV